MNVAGARTYAMITVYVEILKEATSVPASPVTETLKAHFCV